jgi:ribosomal protein L37AE/L43A
MAERETMTQTQSDVARQERLNEVGTEPPCPFCQRPRVTRNTYIRCNPCGVNWSAGDDIFKDPRMNGTKSTSPEPDTGAQPVE